MSIVIGGGLEKLIGFNGVEGLGGHPALAAILSAAACAFATVDVDVDVDVDVVDVDVAVGVDVFVVVCVVVVLAAVFLTGELNPPDAAYIPRPITTMAPIVLNLLMEARRLRDLSSAARLTLRASFWRALLSAFELELVLLGTEI
ncbi:MAG: hypothetical protein M1399_07160 [Actinobacteria bacterium]|nr:hypothetical protein [Actinomycetota bacterium]MCL5446310.1 hypothetical protein [Actinomycetota bacterium]